MVEDIPSQTAMEAIIGTPGSGIFEHIIVDKNIITLEGARQRGLAEMNQYANAIISGSFVTFYDGFRSGQKLHIKLTDRNIDEYYLIKEVQMECIGAGYFIYTITFATLLIGFSWLLIKLLDDTRDKATIENEIIDRIRLIPESVSTSDTESDILKTPPFKWSNDLGTTVNKLQWSEGTWTS
jgi:hypothetical protein